MYDMNYQQKERHCFVHYLSSSRGNVLYHLDHEGLPTTQNRAYWALNYEELILFCPNYYRKEAMIIIAIGCKLNFVSPESLDPIFVA